MMQQAFWRISVLAVLITHLANMDFERKSILKIKTSQALKTDSRYKMDQILPEVNDLPELEDFPDMFTMLDGTRVHTLSDWERRRSEIKLLIQHYEYGFLPPLPVHMNVVELSTSQIFNVKGIYRSLRLEFGEKGTISMTLHLYIPEGVGPFPVIIRGDLCWNSIYEIAGKYMDRGYAFIEFDRTELDKDNPNRIDGLHAAFPDEDFGTLAAWAWGYSRVVDYVMNNPVFDPDKIIFTGHSRGGKTALLAGALDERVALTNVHCSGIGGSGPNRFVITGETIDDITDPTRFHYWFNKRYLDFRGDNLNRLPIDQHFLVALLAPRAYLSTNALGDEWANPEGTMLAHEAAMPAFGLYNKMNNTGLHYREGEHEQNEMDWAILIDFADQVLLGKGHANLMGYPLK